VKELLVRGAELQLRTQPNKTGRRRHPITDSDKPGSLKLDNAKIFEIIPFP